MTFSDKFRGLWKISPKVEQGIRGVKKVSVKNVMLSLISANTSLMRIKSLFP